MNSFAEVLIITAAVSLAGCAATGHRRVEVGVEPRRAADAVDVCETVVYRSPNADRQTTLRCASLLDVWR